MKIEVSNGELLDKYTILSIKLSRIESLVKLNNIRNEYENLTPKVDKLYANCPDATTLESLHVDLHNINLTLWNVEDQIREHERMETFGQDFIELARTVYHINDERAEVKHKINALTESSIVEEKSYESY